MFSGIGGFEYGIEKATEGRWKCVGYSEIDKHAIAVYSHKFPGQRNYGDATRIEPGNLPEFDLLCGGFPCQAFSIAGKRKGFGDTRGTLFFEIARILEVKRPAYILLENVKGLLNHEKGDTFRTIIATLDGMGYEIQWMVLNSKFHGVPQNRERVFIVGSLDGIGRPKILPFAETARKIPEVCGRERESETDPNLKYIGAVMAEKNNKWLEDEKTFSRNFPHGQRVYSADGIEATLSGNAGGLGGKTGLYAIPKREDTNTPYILDASHANKGIKEYKENCSTLNGRDYKEPKCVVQKQPLMCAVLTPDRLNKRQNGRRFKTVGEPSFTLTGQDIHGVSDGTMIRRLTPTECERLQGFPDDWTKLGNYDGQLREVSDTQRYKMLGNAVTTNVITAIARSWDANEF